MKNENKDDPNAKNTDGPTITYTVKIQNMGGAPVMICPELQIKNVECYGTVNVENVKASILRSKPYLDLDGGVDIVISDERVTCDWDEIQKRKKEGRGRDAGSLRAPKF